MEITRRRFFALAGAIGAGGVLATTGMTGVTKLVENPRGAWMWVDGSWLPTDEFPELFDIIGHSYGLSNEPFDMFRLPDLMKLIEAVDTPVPSSGGMLWTTGAREVRSHSHIIKVRPGTDDTMPVGTILAYAGEELPG